MNKDDFNNWLARKVEFQARLTMGAVASMCAIGLIAFIVQGGLFYVLLQWGYGTVTAVVVTLALFGGMGYFTWMTAPRVLCDEEHEVDIDGRVVKIKVAPTMSSAWTYAMGSRDSDISVPERIFGMFMMVPRMFCTAWYLFKRAADVKDIDVRECGAILRFLLKKAERVNVHEIADKRPKTELTKTLRQVSMIDGVVFLSRGEIGLTLAIRFKDEVEKAMSGGNAERKGDSPFDVA